MARPSGEKTRNNGQWSEAKYRSFVKNQLRSATRKWPPISQCLKEARTSRGVYMCASCLQEVPASVRVDRKKVKNVFVDHISPIVPIETGWTTWDEIVDRMFAERENLQVLCKQCHDGDKTAKERKETSERNRTIKSVRAENEGTYYTWANMNDRCHNPLATGYKYYGAKGIEVCERWQRGNGAIGLLNLIEDMGHRPEGKTLDRIDYTKSYYPENCRWASAKEQAGNTSANNWILYEGEWKILEDWGEELGIKPNTILTRLRRGWSIPQALEKEEKPRNLYNGRLSPEDLETIEQLYSEGVSQVEIGERVGLDSSCISRLCKKLSFSKEQNVEVRSRRLKDREEKVISLRDQGKKVSEISEEVGISVSSVYKHLLDQRNKGIDIED